MKQFSLPGMAVLLAVIVLNTACMTTQKTIKPTAKSPGLYGLTGWNGSYMNPATNEATGIDIECKASYRINMISGPTANCVSPSKSWSARHRIISGEFPPGIAFDEPSDRIAGIPTKRGNWVVVIELYEIKCNDTNYMSMKQEIRFHISGSRVVND
jgi:hypothetical protein